MLITARLGIANLAGGPGGITAVSMLIVPAGVVLEVRAQPSGHPATGGSGKVNGTPNTNVWLVVVNDTVTTFPAVTVTVATPTGAWKVSSTTQTSALQIVSAPAVGPSRPISRSAARL